MVSRVEQATLRVQFGRPIWDVELLGSSGDGFASDPYVQVDAQSGLVLGLDVPRCPPEMEAMPGQCIVGRGWKEIYELSLRPSQHHGRLWMPADFARIFDPRAKVRDGKAALVRPDGTVAIEAPVERLDGTVYLQAEYVLAAAQVDPMGIDARRCALAVSVQEKAILARITELGLGQPLKPIPLPPWPAPVAAPAQTKRTPPQKPTQSQLEVIAAAAAEAPCGTKPDSVAGCEWLPGLKPGRSLWVIEFRGEYEDEHWARLEGKTVVLDAGSGEVLGVAVTGLFLNMRKANPAP